MAPTRLAISRNGTVFVVGAGEGRVERFDHAGHALDAWVYTTEPLACMETSALDGPALAFDDDDHLYVVYNLHRPSQKPEAFWAKFAPDGRLLVDAPTNRAIRPPHRHRRRCHLHREHQPIAAIRPSR